MIKELSKNIQAEIREVIEIILDEIELQNIETMGGMFFVRILGKKFKYQGDLGKIIEKINKEIAPQVLHVFYREDLDNINIMFSASMSAESLTKLREVRSTFDLGLGIEGEDCFYFLIEDLEKLKEIKTKIDEASGVEKTILQISKERKEIMRKDNHKFKRSFRSPQGKNKRFEYLIKIYDNPKISGRDLEPDPDLIGKKLQNLSKEIRKMNGSFKNKLNLPDNLIVNESNSGYEINSKYYFEFI